MFSFFKRNKTPDIKLFEHGVNKSDEKFELRYIINKLQEIDKLKLLLLSEEQLILFNFLSKPILTENLKTYSQKM